MEMNGVGAASTEVAIPAVPDGAVSAIAAGRVQLGDHTYQIYEQRIGYLENRLKSKFALLIESELSGRNPVDALGHSAYEVLTIFIGRSRMMPEYEFRGFPTQEAFEAGTYDDRYDRSPGPMQTRAALKLCAEVNSLDFFGALRNLFSEETAQRLGDLLMVQVMERMRSGSFELPQRDSPPTTESDPMSSGTDDSTADDSVASPPLANPSDT